MHIKTSTLFLIGCWILLSLVAQADTPPAWTNFQIQSPNGRYTAEVKSAGAALGKYKLTVYDTGLGAKTEIWSSDYQYDGYPGGILADDGAFFVYVNTWYSEDQPLVTIYYRQVRDTPLQLWSRDFKVDPGAIEETASHRIWLDAGVPYQLKSTDEFPLALEVNMRGGKKHIVDLNSGKIISAQTESVHTGSDKKSCEFLTDCAWAWGFAGKLGGCNCYNKKYIAEVLEGMRNGIHGSGPIPECLGPSYVDTACLCVERQCQMDYLTGYTENEIPQSQALDIAKKLCEQKGYEWKDVSIGDAGNTWFVRTGRMLDGGNADIHIDKSTGAIVDEFNNPE